MSILAKTIATGLMVPVGNPETALLAPNQKFGVPMCFTGLPGVGKSERIMAVIAKMQLYPHLVSIPTKNLEDLQGYKVQDGHGQLARVSDDPVLKRLSESGSGVIFLDEINTRRESLHTALLDVLLNRRMGGYAFPGDVRFISAKNPEEASTGGIEFGASLANRFCHLSWEAPTSDAYADFLCVGGSDSNDDLKDVEPEESYRKLLVKNWEMAWTKVRAVGIGFTRAKSSELHKLPPPESPSFSGAWASNRTWYWALRALATARALNMPGEVGLSLMAGCVGAGVVPEFVNYEREANLPSPEEVLEKGFTASPKADINLAVYMSLATYITQSNAEQKRKNRMAEKAWRILGDGVQHGWTDLTYKAASILTRSNLGMTQKDDKELVAAVIPVMAKLSTFHKDLK